VLGLILNMPALSPVYEVSREITDPDREEFARRVAHRAGQLVNIISSA
jgi:hypothetical protein